jgi:hypothetical protein
MQRLLYSTRRLPVTACGEPIQTVEHVLLRYQNTSPRADRRYITANGRPHRFSQLFIWPELVEGSRLLQFLEEMGVCAKPRTVWEPG